MSPIQGLSYLALVQNAVRGGSERRWFAVVGSGVAALVTTLSPFSIQAQQTPGSPDPLLQPQFSISAERLDQIHGLRPDMPYLTYSVRDQLLDNFDRRSLELYAMREHLKRQDFEEMRDTFAHTTKRRVERSITRTVVRAFENTAFVQNIKEEPWKERIFGIFKDAITEETPTIGTPIGEDDPHVDYDVEKPVIQKPAWKDRVSFFVRPWSLHPNVGVGFKLDGVRAQIKAYHDEVKFSLSKPITDDWSVYTAIRMKDFIPEDTSFSVGFQHSIRCVPGIPPALFQYGVNVKNRPFWQRGERLHEFRPSAYMHFVFDY